MGSPHSIIKLIGHDREAGRPLSPEQAQRGVKTTIPFTLNNGMVANDPNSFLLWIDQVSSSGITITMTGFGLGSSNKLNIPNPLRLDWYLYAAGECIMDDEPVWEGSTWLDVAKGSNARNGRLIQCSGLAAQSWFLRGVMQDPTVPVELKGSLEYHCPSEPVVGGPFLSAGTFVG
jgi:hypothetical protein